MLTLELKMGVEEVISIMRKVLFALLGVFMLFALAVRADNGALRAKKKK